jgi:hypothetical protein
MHCGRQTTTCDVSNCSCFTTGSYRLRSPKYLPPVERRLINLVGDSNKAAKYINTLSPSAFSLRPGIVWNSPPIILRKAFRHPRMPKRLGHVYVSSQPTFFLSYLPPTYDGFRQLRLGKNEYTGPTSPLRNPFRLPGTPNSSLVRSYTGRAVLQSFGAGRPRRPPSN